MPEIGMLDKNLAVMYSLGRDDIEFYDPRKEPFALYGVFFEDGQYRRLPDAAASKVSGGVRELAG